MSNLQIPFVLEGKKGMIDIIYKANDSVVESGFDLLTSKGFDVNMCIGYPTLHAKVKDFEATGYRRYCGWIQIIESEYFGDEDLQTPRNTVTVIDSDPALGPFFCHGYPAELYDAPCNNLGNNAKLNWTAYTYFVSMPTALNGEIISFKAGFKWGYSEWDENGERKVKIIPAEEINENLWQKHLEILKKEFPNFSYT